ncbi:MAG TPA: hypothetical protein VM286_04735 [Candidatus Thermoplasmatota archaeon]|nr:hypothetical protein [Candidatus Thermoplasmatota archaeon]
MTSPLAASRRVKDNRFFQNRVEIGPPSIPTLPGQGIQKGEKTAAQVALEEDAEIRGFLHEQGPVADGVRRVLLSIRQKRRELGNEWDVRGAVAHFVQAYAHAVPNADKEYLRGMNLALKVYLSQKEAI